jgi:hypothetical protein
MSIIQRSSQPVRQCSSADNRTQVSTETRSRAAHAETGTVAQVNRVAGRNIEHGLVRLKSRNSQQGCGIPTGSHRLQLLSSIVHPSNSPAHPRFPRVSDYAIPFPVCSACFCGISQCLRRREPEFHISEWFVVCGTVHPRSTTTRGVQLQLDPNEHHALGQHSQFQRTGQSFAMFRRGHHPER